MTKDFKNLKKEEIANLFENKAIEIESLINKIKADTSYMIDTFFVVGIRSENSDEVFSRGLVYGEALELGSLLQNQKEYRLIQKSIALSKLLDLFDEDNTID